MAKSSYKIPTTLDVSYFDMEFNLKYNGIGFKKPVSAKVVVSALLAIVAWFYLIFQTFINSGGVPVIIGFTIGWAGLSVLLVKADKTQRMGFELVMSAITYIPKSGRELPVRLSDRIGPLKSFYNLNYVDEEDGLIHFRNGQIGHVYHIVGSASSLMFEEDKIRILNHVDNFYRKAPYAAQIIYDTVYEAHVVTDQIASAKQDQRQLKSHSEGLEILANEKRDILENALSGDSGLISLHQYAIIVADDQEALRNYENLLIGDVDNEGIMFRLARTLDYEDVIKYFNSLYT